MMRDDGYDDVAEDDDHRDQSGSKSITDSTSPTAAGMEVFHWIQ